MQTSPLLLGTLMLGAALLPATTHAQYRTFVTGDSGLYWTADAGAAIPQDGHLTSFGPWAAGQKVKYDVGAAFDVGFGYLFNKYVGTELDVGGTFNSINSIEGASLHDTSFSTVPIMANLMLQYPIPQTIVVPYLGLGVGGAATFFDTDHLDMPVPGGGVSLHGNDEDFVFAWQAMAGVRFKLDQRMSIGAGYRFLHTDSSSYTFESHHHNAPDFDLGISSHEVHLVLLTFLMKF